jgi:predicted nucleic acid-binding protein
MILDTNALSALGNREPAIIEYLKQSPEPVLCFIVVAEYRRGLLNSTKPERGNSMLATLNSTLAMLHWDNETLTHYAEIGHHLKITGRPIPTNDIWIAALARQHDMPVLSRDRHFDFIPGIRRLEW